MVLKYQQIQEWILNRLESGELSAGDKLESENQISMQFGSSRQTVRRALSELIEKGVLESRQGSGTFVKVERSSSPCEIRLSKVVTIVSTYVDGYIFLRVLQTMANTLEQNGYSVRIVFTQNHREKEREILEELIREPEKGPLIAEPVMSGLPNLNLKLYRELQKQGVPILFFHAFYPELDIPHVSMNDVEAGRKATEYLISKGHRKIAAIFKMDDGQGILRYRGYLEALEAAGIPLLESRVLWIDTYELDHFMQNNTWVWERLSDSTACVCYNDMVACKLTEDAVSKGINIPEDLSIIGIDNADIAKNSVIPITSVDHPKDTLGRKVAENMIRLLEDPEFDANYEFSVHVEERESTAALE